MATQVFDDGTVINYADDGSVINYTDTSGNVFKPDSSVGRDYIGAFVDTVAKGFNQKLREAFNPSVSRAAVAGGPAVVSKSPAWLVPALLVGAVALAAKFLK